MRIVAPSILSCNFMELEKEINKINNSKAKWLHFDVMDGHFVKNISFGPDIFKYFKNNSSLFMDVHLMVTNPKFIGDLFIEAGANLIVFHYEACASDIEAIELVEYFQKKNVNVGVSIKPKTDVNDIIMLLDYVDLVLVMSVEPGFGGQSFIESSLEKIRQLKEYKDCNDLDFIIQVDGGISSSNKEACYEAGAECLVAGSYLFKQSDFNKGVESLL